MGAKRSAHLAEDEVIGPEDLSERAGAHGIHGAGLLQARKRPLRNLSAGPQLPHLQKLTWANNGNTTGLEELTRSMSTARGT